MKPTQFTKKLLLGKTTVSNLEMRALKGGDEVTGCMSNCPCTWDKTRTLCGGCEEEFYRLF